MALQTLPSGLWLPEISGGAGMVQNGHPVIGWPDMGGASVGAQTTVALDSNYVAGTGGDAICARYVPPANVTVNNIYLFITGYTGTAANVNDINWEIRTGTNLIPDATAPGLVASGLVDPASATGWINISGLSAALTGGTTYWFIVGDADGNVTDYASVLQHHSMSFATAVAAYETWLSGTTANGFSTITRSGVRSTLLARMNNGLTYGSPFTANNTTTSSTNRKGLYVGGLTEQLKLWGWFALNAGANLSGIELFSGVTGPGGTPDASSTQVYADSAGTDTGAILATSATLAKSTVYRTVFTYSAAVISSPRRADVGAGNDSNVLAAMLGAGGWYWAEASGTTDWSNDLTTGWPLMGWLVEDQVAVADGGGRTRPRYALATDGRLT